MVRMLTGRALHVCIAVRQKSDREAHAGASELAVSTLRHLMRPFGPSTIWQAIHGKQTSC